MILYFKMSNISQSLNNINLQQATTSKSKKKIAKKKAMRKAKSIKVETPLKAKVRRKTIKVKVLYSGSD